VIASKLGKKFAINAWLFIAVLLLAVIIPSLLYWTIERNDMHARWQTEFHLSQTFAFYGMDQAFVLVVSPSFASNTTASYWARSAVQTGSITLNQVAKLDYDRANQLFRIENMLDGLATSWSTYTTSLNPTQRQALGGLLHTIGRDILFAYSNYLNYTSADDIKGPSFWYTGPSPPDLNLVQQATDLGVNLPGLPPLPP
jgi:hypothetical protein